MLYENAADTPILLSQIRPNKKHLGFIKLVFGYVFVCFKLNLRGVELIFTEGHEFDSCFNMFNAWCLISPLKSSNNWHFVG